MKIFLIGIGTGNLNHLTLEAVNTLNNVDLILIPKKNSETLDLLNIRLEICKALIAAGTTVDKGNVEGTTPLFIAIAKKHTKILNHLIANGANCNKTDKDGRFPLYVAAHHGYVEGVSRLLEEGATINQRYKDGKTSLFISAESGHHEVVKVLIAAGAEIDKPNNIKAD